MQKQFGIILLYFTTKDKKNSKYKEKDNSQFVKLNSFKQITETKLHGFNIAVTIIFRLFNYIRSIKISRKSEM
jgi:hypothetical protein